MAQQLDDGDTLKHAGEGSALFDFEKWTNKNKLSEIKQLFIDHDMITLNTLSMNSNNFAKLMADKRLLIKPHLIQNIVPAILSLQQLTNQQQSASMPNKEKEKTKLIFVSAKKK
eukprot:290839_1